MWRQTCRSQEAPVEQHYSRAVLGNCALGLLRHSGARRQHMAGAAYALLLLLLVVVSPAANAAANTSSVELIRSDVDYLSIEDANQSGLDLTGDFTLELWVKLASQPVDRFYLLDKHGGTTGQRGYRLRYFNESGVLTLGIALTDSTDTRFQFDLPTTLPLATWTHIAVSFYAATSQLIIYVDGAPIGDTTAPIDNINANSQPFTIGTVSDGSPVTALDALVDEVRVWNVLRTASQIAGSLGEELAPPVAGLVGYWRFENDFTDSSGFDNNFVAHGSPMFSGDTPFGQPCGDGTVQEPEECDDGNAEDGDCCSATCQYEAQGATCTDDGNVCTDNECDGAGTCDAINNTASCDDLDACTQTDICSGGTCVGGNPVVCTASDQCHDVGSCDSQTGQCSDPAKQDGTECSDDDACTLTDTCQSGVCTPGTPVVCVASDQCHDVGECDSQSGLCTNPAKEDGSPCDDELYCTTPDTCTAGVCGGNARDCGDGVGCTVDSCNEATDSCDNVPDDGLCDDSDPCTVDACDPATDCGSVVEPAPDEDADPVNGCKIAEINGLLVADLDKDRADKIRWKWIKGTCTNADFGEPDVYTQYDVCIYDTLGGEPSLFASLTIPPDPDKWLQGRDDMWKYRDKLAEPDGVLGMLLKSGENKCKLTLKAGGENLPTFTRQCSNVMCIDSTVTLQLHSSEGVCWTSGFDSAVKNTDRKFKTKRRIRVVVQ